MRSKLCRRRSTSWAAYEIDEILDQMIEQGIDGIPADVYEGTKDVCAMKGSTTMDFTVSYKSSSDPVTTTAHGVEIVIGGETSR